MAETTSLRRVAITGAGVVCAIGHSYEEFVDGLRTGRDGLSIDVDGHPGAAPMGAVVGWTGPIDDRLSTDLTGPALRCELLMLDAARQAIDGAGLALDGFDHGRVGVYLGTCQGFVGEPASVRVQAKTLSLTHLADDLARLLGLRGPAVTTTNACSASGAAFALAFDQIRRGRIDAAVVGGAESLAQFTIAGFGSLRSLDPLGCSPYGRSGGLSVGEGAAMFVLEDFDAAVARQAPILAELAGAAMSADAYHPTAPDPTGRGAMLAMNRALRSAGLGTDDVGYVNGHGTGTQANDEMERVAFRKLFGDRSGDVPISSTKSQIGHLLGAAGALEAAACVAAIANDVLPPTIRQPELTREDIDVVAQPGRTAGVDVTVSVNYAFGGSNSAMVISRPSSAVPRGSVAAPSRVVLSGIGAVGALGIGLDAWRDAVDAGSVILHDCEVASGTTMLAAPLPLMTKRFASGGAWRRMDEFERAVVASAQLAWKDSGLRLSQDRQSEVAVIAATNAGSIGSVIQYSQQVERGLPDPGLFPHVPINSASGHVCTTMGFNGPNLSISAGGASTIAAIEAAIGLLETGEIEVALVCCVDDMPLDVLRYAHRDGALVGEGKLAKGAVRPFDDNASGTAPGGAAITLVLEREDHALERDATPWARILSTSLLRAGNDHDEIADCWKSVFGEAAARGGIDLSSIDVCFAAAAGVADVDLTEACAIGDALPTSCRVSAPKSIVGECIGADGAVNVAFAALALRDGFVAPTRGLTSAAGPHLRHVRAVETDHSVRRALANASSGGGSYGTILLEAW